MITNQEGVSVLTVGEVNQTIAAVLKDNFPNPFWVTGEVQGYDRDAVRAGARRWRQVYFELVEKEQDKDTVQAGVKALMWGDVHSAVSEKLKGISGRAWWIMLGMLLGTFMWFNVWFVIWPAQKRLLGLCSVTKATPEEAGPIRTKAAKASRINTFLSGPMLFGMLAAPHYGEMSWKALVFIAIAMVVIGRAYALSIKIKTN